MKDFTIFENIDGDLELTEVPDESYDLRDWTAEQARLERKKADDERRKLFEASVGKDNSKRRKKIISIALAILLALGLTGLAAYHITSGYEFPEKYDSHDVVVDEGYLTFVQLQEEKLRNAMIAKGSEISNFVYEKYYEDPSINVDEEIMNYLEQEIRSIYGMTDEEIKKKFEIDSFYTLEPSARVDYISTLHGVAVDNLKESGIEASQIEELFAKFGWTGYTLSKDGDTVLITFADDEEKFNTVEVGINNILFGLTPEQLAELKGVSR